MEIRLPSSGKMGIYKLNVRMPKLNDLREVSSLDDDENIAKTQFLLNLVENKQDFFKISTYDRDFLFVMVAGNMFLNKLEFRYTCSCGEQVDETLNLAECSFETLSPEVQRVNKKKIYGTEYEFIIPSVLDETKMFDWVYSIDDAVNATDPDAPEELKTLLRHRLEDGAVCMILGKEVNDETVEWVRDLDLMVYFLALDFYVKVFHGFKTVKLCTCPKCGAKNIVKVPIVGGVKSFDTKDIIARFVMMQESIDFKSFMDLTIPEYVSLKNAQPI